MQKRSDEIQYGDDDEIIDQKVYVEWKNGKYHIVTKEEYENAKRRT